MKSDNGFISEVAGLATIGIFLMTLVTFGITTGAWEASLWESNMEIVDYEGQWGEDLVVTYTDGSDESVKQISNSYWSTMAIEDEGSKIITSLQYCLNAKIPISDSFDITGYECTVTVTQNSVVAYRITFTYVALTPVSIEANKWTRVATVSFDIESVSENLNNGLYIVSFANVGTIENINVPDGRSIDISVEDGIVRFLI